MLPASLMKANLQLSMRLRAYVQNLPGIKIWKTILWVVKVKNKEKKLTTTKTFFLTQSVKAVFLSHTLIWHAVFWKGYRLCFICDLVFSRQTGLTFSLYMVKLNSAIRIVFYHLCEDDDISSALPFDHFPMQSSVCKPITDWLTLWSMCQRAGSSRSHRKRGNFSSLLTQIYSSFVCFFDYLITYI